MRGLDERIAATYGVTVETSSIVPRGARPAQLLAAAVELARAIGGRPAHAPAPVERTWSPLPAFAMAPIAAAERAAAVDRLVAWAIAGGARFDALGLRVAAGGACTAHARRPIAEGERVLTMPRRLMIVDDALATSATGSIDPYGPVLHSPADTLAAWLPLELARPDSPWRPYLDVLPRALPDVACFQPDLDDLAGTEARAAAIVARDRVVDSHGWLDPTVGARVDLAAFAWARAILRSRGYGMTIDGHARAALIPIVDLLDHRPGDTRWGYDAAEDAWTITALRAFAAGDEVHANYGALSSGRLLVHYGFALPDNPEDEAALVFPPAADPRVDLAGHLLWRLPLAAPVRVVVGTRADDRLRRALSIARLRAAPIEALTDDAFERGELGRLDDRGEAAAREQLAGAVRGGLAALDAPAELSRTPWQRACALVRRGERAVLEQVLALAR